MTPDLQATRLKDALKRLMKTQGRTYAALAAHLGVSLATVKRILSREELGLARLLEICRWVGVSLAELEAAADALGVEDAVRFTEDQETFLSADPRYLGYLYLLYDGYTPAKIAKEKGLTKKSTDRYILRLEQHGLIRATEKGHAAPAHKKAPSWISKGPLARAHYARLLANFSGFFTQKVHAKFDEAPGATPPVYSSMHAGGMSRETYDAMQRELDAVTRRYLDTASVELKVHGEAGLGKLALMVCHTWLTPGARVDELEQVFGDVTNL